MSLSYRYVYTDEADINVNNVLGVLYTAEKYGVQTLCQTCEDFLSNHLNGDNALQIMDQAITYNLKDLEKRAAKIIEKEATLLLASEAFQQLSRVTLMACLRLDLKVASEKLVVDGCIQWAKEKCRREGKMAEGREIREVLGDAFHLIRFPCLTAEEFSDIASEYEFFSSDEERQVCDLHV